MQAAIQQPTNYFRPIHHTREAQQTVEFHSGFAGSNTSFEINSNTYTVPAGKRLVVESIDGSVSLGSAGSINCWLVVGKSDPAKSYALGFQPPTGAETGREYEVALNALVCVEPLGSISFWLARGNATGCWSAAFKARGYLINAAEEQ